MKRRHVLLTIAGIGLALRVPESGAQSGGKPTVIGLLDASDRDEYWVAFRGKFRELGYVEDRNVTFEFRAAKGNLDLLAPFAQELTRLNVRLIVTSGTAAALAARRATSKIPIVMATGTDQVSVGLAASLARPGGNVTGVATMSSELMPKRLELLREVVPKMQRVALLWHADNLAWMASVKELEVVTEKLKIALRIFGVRSAEELADAFAGMTKERVEGLIVVQSPFASTHRKRIVELAIKHRLPSAYGAASFVAAGGLFSYAPDYLEMFRYAAVYADKILKGANPADLPIEQPSKLEIVVNLKTAQAIGITVPRAILTRADQVIQ